MDEDLDEVSADQARVDAARAERERRLDERAERGSRPVAEPDILVIVEGFVPVYNPSPYPMMLRGGGEVFTIRAEGIDMVSEIAAQVALGEGYGGTNKPLSKLGLRRLRQPDARYSEAAERSGFKTVDAWVFDQNRRIVGDADAAWEAAQHDEKMNVPDMTAITRGRPRAPADH